MRMEPAVATKFTSKYLRVKKSVLHVIKDLTNDEHYNNNYNYRRYRNVGLSFVKSPITSKTYFITRRYIFGEFRCYSRSHSYAYRMA